jgi:hypothetical protein
MTRLINQLLLCAACTAAAGLGMAFWLGLPKAAPEFLFIASAGFSGLVALVIHALARHRRGRRPDRTDFLYRPPPDDVQ